jgi:hypothetical protein
LLFFHFKYFVNGYLRFPFLPTNKLCALHRKSYKDLKKVQKSRLPSVCCTAPLGYEAAAVLKKTTDPQRELI